MKVYKDLLFLWPIVVWSVGGAATFLLNVFATWRSGASIPAKLLANATVDPLLAVWWPITWAIWGVLHLLGYQTTLDLVSF